MYNLARLLDQITSISMGPLCRGTVISNIIFSPVRSRSIVIEARTKWLTFCKRIFLKENICILINTSKQFAPRGVIDKLILVKAMARRQQAITLTNVDKGFWRHMVSISLNGLTHWGRDQIDAISQTTVSNAFSWMKMLEFWLWFHWSLFLRFELTIFQHWFIWHLSIIYYLNQWWLVYWRIYASLGLNELICRIHQIHPMGTILTKQQLTKYHTVLQNVENKVWYGVPNTYRYTQECYLGFFNYPPPPPPKKKKKKKK